MRAFTAALVLACLGAACCRAQTPPVVTIDSERRFCVNGVPTFLIGTMGGDEYAWNTFLKPAGFNFRFLGSTTVPGAHSVGLWEVPDVFANPSQVASMRSDPGYLMWDVDYQSDYYLLHPADWVGHLPIDIAAGVRQCVEVDGPPRRPVGTCWGNWHETGSEFWGRDGYWHAYRHLAQIGDYFVSGEFNVGFIREQTVSHAVRMSAGPVIALNRCWPSFEVGGDKCPDPVDVRIDIWQAAVVGAKGIVIDRYEMQESGGYWRNWPNWFRDHWAVIQKGCSEIQQIAPVLLAPGPWLYYSARPAEDNEFRIIYTYRKVGSDLYLIACNLWPVDPHSLEITVPIPEQSAVGEVFFDYVATGAVITNPTATTITDTTKNWPVNSLAGHRLWIRHGTPAHDHYYPIAGNTSDTITIASGDLLADGVARGNLYKVIELIQLANRRFTLRLESGGRKVIRFPNVTYSYPVARSAAAASAASNRRWKLLMDYSNQIGGEPYPVDGYGMCYDSGRRRLVAQGGLMNPYPSGKPNPTDPDVVTNRNVWEWDIDTGFYSGPIGDGEQQGGDPWPVEDFYYGDMVYDPVRQRSVSFLKNGAVQEWRGIEQGWRVAASEIPNRTEGPITHYAACYDALNQRLLLYGGKDWTALGSNYRNWQFYYEWFNLLYAWNGTAWSNLNNPEVNFPVTALEEPVMCWDSARNRAVLFGLAHDGRWSRDIPQRVFQDTPQQTYEFLDGTNAARKHTTHVPYVYANYQMVFDPRTSTTLLFGGLPSVNGRATDLYEYTGTDWRRLDYRHDDLPAQDVRRIPTLAYDPDHEMVLFLDTRGHRIWGLTSGLETQVSTLAGAKALADGTLLAVDGLVASRRYDGFFYAQSADRTSGIRVASGSTAVSEGSLVNVVGTISTLPTGERQISAKVVGVAGTGSAAPLAAVNWAASGGLPDLTGVLVRVFGRVTGAGSGYVVVDDGSGVGGVRVVLNGADAPASGAYIGATGAASLVSADGLNVRAVLIASAADIAVYD